MSYLDESLSSGEEVVAVFERHWVTLLPIIGWAVLVVTLPVSIYQYLQWRFLEQAVTNRRLVHKEGIISRRTAEMKLSAIETIDMDQSILGRILGYGHVRITGRGMSAVVLRAVKDPVAVKRTIEGVMPAPP
ncbi:MAG: PH domain-containing protein [Gammaproteobacteria bacterium]